MTLFMHFPLFLPLCQRSQIFYFCKCYKPHDTLLSSCFKHLYIFNFKIFINSFKIRITNTVHVSINNMLDKKITVFSKTKRNFLRMTMIYIFVLCYIMSGLIDNGLFFIPECCNVVFVKVYEENPVSHRYVVRKGRNVLRTFIYNYGYSSLILHKNCTNGSLLRVNSVWNLKSYQ